MRINTIPPAPSTLYQHLKGSHCEGKAGQQPHCASGLGQGKADIKPHSSQPKQWREMPACHLRRMLELTSPSFSAKALWDHHAKMGGSHFRVCKNKPYEGNDSRQTTNSQGLGKGPVTFSSKGQTSRPPLLFAAWFGEEANDEIPREAAAFASPA